MSPTVLVSISSRVTTANTLKIAANEAGKLFVTFGNPHMISMVSDESPSIQYSEVPCSQCPSAS